MRLLTPEGCRLDFERNMFPSSKSKRSNNRVISYVGLVQDLRSGGMKCRFAHTIVVNVVRMDVVGKFSSSLGPDVVRSLRSGI
jgi:hypothetical protein